MKKFYTLLLCASLAAQMPAHAHYTAHSTYSYNQDNNGFLAGIVGVGVAAGAALGVYGLGKAAGWWGQPSNQEVIDTARANLQAVKRYDALLTPFTQAQQNNAIDPLNEALLYELALIKRSSNKSLSTSTLNWRIGDLKKAYQGLVERADYLLNNMHAMRDWTPFVQLPERMLKKLNELKSLYCYLTKHASYFALFEAEDRIQKKYSQELSLAEQFAHNPQALLHALHVRAQSRYSGSYALISYAKSFHRTLNELSRTASKVAYHYENRITCAQRLLQQLRYMYDLIVSDPSYSSLVAQQERAKQEEERLRLERERVRIEKELVRAERERMRLERERIYLERERLEILNNHNHPQHCIAACLACQIDALLFGNICHCIPCENERYQIKQAKREERQRRKIAQLKRQNEQARQDLAHQKAERQRREQQRQAEKERKQLEKERRQQEERERKKKEERKRKDRERKERQERERKKRNRESIANMHHAIYNGCDQF